MSKVFISHSSKDVQVATELVKLLESVGVQCWYAKRDVQGGKKYSEKIVEQIKKSEFLIVLLTQAAYNSPHVEKELAIASKYETTLLPIRLDASKPPDGWDYFLELSQWIDAVVPPGGKAVTDLKRISKEVLKVVSGNSRTQLPVVSRRSTSGAAASVPVIDTSANGNQESLDNLSVKSAMRGMELRKAKKTLDELALDIARQRELSAQVAADEMDLAIKSRSIKERRERAQLDEQRLQGELVRSNAKFAKLCDDHTSIVQRIRQSQETFDHHHAQVAKIARDCFLAGNDLRSLRLETARAISFPVNPSLDDFIDVFGFLGSAFGLPSARNFWDEMARSRSLSNLALYNRAVSLLFRGGDKDCLPIVVRELEVVQQRLSGSRECHDEIAACIFFEKPPLRGSAFVLRVWRKEPFDSDQTRRLRDVIDGALSTLSWVISKDRAHKGWNPALLPDDPWMVDDKSPIRMVRTRGAHPKRGSSKLDRAHADHSGAR